MEDRSYPEGFRSIWETLQQQGVSTGRRADTTIAPPELAETLAALTEAPPSPARREEEPPDLELLGLLGEGGMGRVALARQRSLDREVAVKSVRPDRLHPGTVEALLREARIAGSLEHPNIVPVHALLGDPGNPLLVMKRVEGVSWRELIAAPEHPAWSGFPGDRLSRHLEILRQVCNAVAFAHSRGVVHRDLKPQNVMLGEYGEVYVVDWGVALRPGQSALDAIVGTPAYMAPEMLRGGAGVSPRTDVYLLGATLHEILTGAPPHQGGSIKETLLSAYHSRPREYGPAVPAELGEICNRALHQEPAARFEGAAELGQVLSDFLRRRGSVELSGEATRRLGELRGLLARATAEAEGVAIRKLFVECRFGFQQALRVWPENPGAREGTREGLELMIGYELAQRNLSAAEALLAELPAPPPALLSSLEGLRRQLAEEDEARERLRRLEHDFDQKVSSRQRALVAAALILVDAVGTGAVILLERQGEAHLIPVMLVLMGSSTLAGSLVILLVLRGIFLKTRVNRIFTYALILGFFSSWLNRLLGFLRGTPYDQVEIGDIMLVGVGLSMLGLATSPLFIWAGMLFFATALLGTLLPGYATALLGAAVAVVFVPLALLWSRPAVDPSLDKQEHRSTTPP
jgi:eukaryotic-like serine/threonine-protein kinase